MEEANQFTKETEDLAERINDHVIAANENRIAQKQIDEQMKRMVEDSEEEADVDVTMYSCRTFWLN